MPSAVRAETVYEFATACHEDQLNTCFNLIRDRLDSAESEGARPGLLPAARLGHASIHHQRLPISSRASQAVVSAARFGKAEEPVDIAMRDILKAIYPCE